MDKYKVKMWDSSGRALFDIKEADPKKLRKKFNGIVKEKLG